MTEKMPTLFIGHGSPINAIEDNEFSRGWKEIANRIPRPKAILCISAHWCIPELMIGTTTHPKTIHDFWGFPQKLYEQHYPAHGNPDFARMISQSIRDIHVGLDNSWGLDHGVWSVLMQMYPQADIPVIQISIDNSKPPQFHYDVGSKLTFLREQGILILGSGNLVHNLGAMDPDTYSPPYKWATEFETEILVALQANNDRSLINFKELGKLAKQAHPFIDHYLPLLYAKGAGGDHCKLTIFNQKVVHGSISMASALFD